MSKLELLQKALNDYFSDTSQSKEECRGGLQDLMDEIDILLDMLDEGDA